MDFSENLKHCRIPIIWYQSTKNIRILNFPKSQTHVVAQRSVDAQTFCPNDQVDMEVDAQWSN
jgi:hypothetical protein